MRCASIVRTLALGFAVAGMAAACRSVPNPPSHADGGFVSFAETLPDDGLRHSRALARYSEGIHFETGGQFDKAEQAYRLGLAEDPSCDELAIRIGVNLAARRKMKDALSFAEEFIAANPGAQGTAVWLATTYLDAEEYDRAGAIGRDLAARAPTNAAAWIIQARAALRGDRTADPAPAIDILEDGIAHATPPTPVRRELVSTLLRQLRIAGTPAEPYRPKAIDQLRAIDAEEPSDTKILSVLADLLLQSGDVAEAFACSSRLDLLESAAHDGPVAIRKSLLSGFERMDPDEADNVLEQLIKDNPRDPLPLVYRAELRFAREDLLGAAEDYRRADQLNPSVPYYGTKQAAMLADAGDYPQALAVAEALDRRFPDDPSILQLASVLAAALHNFAKAARFIERAEAAIAATPNFDTPPFFHITAADTYAHLRRHDDAARHLLLACEDAAPRRAELDFTPVAAFVDRGLMATPSARQLYAATLRAFAAKLPASPLPHLFLAKIASSPAAALREFDAAVALANGNPESLPIDSRYLYISVLDSTGRRDEAIAQLEALLHDSPDCHPAANYLAYVLALRDERLDYALSLVQSALEAAPSNYAYLDTLAWVLYRQGRFDEAFDAIQRARAAMPEEIIAHDGELVGHYNAILHEVDPDAAPLPLPAPQQDE